MGVLDGIRVIDFGRYIAGPFCATLLADLGADVIRVEKTTGSEDRYTTPVTDDGTGAGHLQIGRNKRGITLDPKHADGREVLRRLVATADVVVANLPAATLASMGLDYDSLVEVKPDIILTTMSAYGSTGPYRDRVGFDGVAQAMSGNMHLSGHPDEPMKSYVPYVDYSTAALSALGTVAALYERRTSGKGQVVEGTLLSSALTIANQALIEEAMLGLGRVGTGNRGQTAGPVDAFRTRDGWILVQIVGDPLFRRWAELMGEPEWLEDPRFASDQARGDNGAALSERMSRWTAERTTAEALEQLAGARIPCGEVLEPARTLSDPQIVARGLLQPLDYPGLRRPAPVATTPVSLSRTPGTIRHRAPLLSEHTDAVLRELGYDAEEIARLREAGAV